jgi:prolyl-tRNA synthetase
VLDAAHNLAHALRSVSYHGSPLRVEVDSRDISGGTKSWEWIKKGAPLRVEIGPRDLEKETVAVARRDRAHKEKTFPTMGDFVAQVADTLDDIQATLLARATEYRDKHTVRIDSKEDFYAFFTPKNADKPEVHGGFALAHWNGSAAVEEQIKEDLKVTIRCIPTLGQIPGADEPGVCVITGEPSPRRVLFAKSY